MADSFVLSVDSFLGLDQRAGCSTTVSGFPELVNFKTDESGSLKKRGGYDVFATHGTNYPISALWSDDDKIFALKGNEILKEDAGTLKRLYTAVNTPYSFVSFGDKLYTLGADMLSVTWEAAAPVKGYTPLIATACAPAGAGTVYEPPNVLSAKRRIRYSCDGKSHVYRLPETDIAAVDAVTIDGEVTALSFEADLAAGSITFDDIPNQGVNNMEITYTAVHDAEKDSMIRGCRYGTVFENRLFLYGNPEHPNYVFHSEHADGIPCGEYFAETGYHVFDEPVVSVCGCYNRLIVFCEDKAYYTYGELKADTLGNTYTSFPVYELSACKGSLIEGNAVAYNNMPITLAKDGLNRWVSTEIADERAADLFSERAFKHVINMKKLTHTVHILNRRSASELWIAYDEGILIYNYGLDRFYFYDIRKVGALEEYGTGVLLGMYDGSLALYDDDTLTDNGKPICAYFATPFCTFGQPYELKALSGVSITAPGKKELICDLTLSRGNACFKEELSSRLFLPAISESGCRRARARLHAKRFYSCKLRLTTLSEDVCITELHLFCKALKGGLRVR